MKEKLKGGKGDGRPDSDFDPKWLAVGIKVEMEHTNDKALAKEIAKDHLTEDILYYKKLRKMEKASLEDLYPYMKKQKAANQPAPKQLPEPKKQLPAPTSHAVIRGERGGQYYLDKHGHKQYTGQQGGKQHHQTVQNIKTAAKHAMIGLRDGKIGSYNRARAFLAQYNNHKDENVRKVVASAHDVLHRAAEHMKGRAKTVKAKHIYSLISEHHKAKAGSRQGSSSSQIKKNQSKEQYHASLSKRMKAKVEKLADKIHDDLDRGYDLDHDENTSKMSRFAHAASKQSAGSKSPLVHRRLAAMHHAARDAHWRLYKKWGDKDNMKQYKLHDERAKAHIETASKGASKDGDLSKSISVSLLKAKKRKGEAGMVLKKVQTKSGKMVNRWVKQGSEAPKPKSKKRIKSSPAPSKSEHPADAFFHKYDAKDHFGYGETKQKVLAGHLNIGVPHDKIDDWVAGKKSEHLKDNRRHYDRIKGLVDSKDQKTLESLLHHRNKMWKEMFHHITGVKLPDTDKGTKTAIAQYLARHTTGSDSQPVKVKSKSVGKEKNSKAMKTKTKKTTKTKKAKKESNFHALQLELDKVTRNPENRRKYTDKLNWKLLDSALKEGDPTVVSRALTHIREVLK